MTASGRGADGPLGTVPGALEACPHLRSVDGPWHAVAPSRAHRCELLAAGRPTLERQRLHCLGRAHDACPTWLETHRGELPADRPGSFVPTRAVVLEGPGLGLPPREGVRHLAGPASIVVVGLAVGAFVLARGPLAPGTPGTGGDTATPTPTAAPATPASATASPSTPTATATPRPPQTPAPTATPRPTTYKVKRGDTLTGIAARFGTTVKAIAELNGISDPSLIRPGQVLKLP